MAKRIVNTINITVDWGSLIEGLGAYTALVSIDDDEYINEIVKVAHGRTENVFNTEAAASANAGNFRHMYEWGTAGINNEKTNMVLQPNSPAARLWYTDLIGFGMNQMLMFEFRDSVAIVPKPTTENTNMDDAIIKNLHDHVFTNKASFLESGMEVSIMPKNAKVLIIPVFNDRPNPWASPDDVERGFKISAGPSEFSEGHRAKTAGSFSTFWLNFWEGQGQILMNAYMEEEIYKEFLPYIEAPPHRGVKGVLPGGITVEVNKVAHRIRKTTLQRARRARERANRL